MNDIRGMLLPLPTVFDDAGMIDEPVVRQMVDYYIGAGIHAMFVGGSMGQGMALTQDERKKLFDIVIGQVKKRIPVVAHVGTADPYSTIDLGKYALRAGADALATVGPYYYSDRTPAELRAHFKMVGKALTAPILLYNNPKYQGYPMSGELMAQFVEDSPQIFGCKLAKGGIDELVAYRATLGPDFKLFAMASSLFPGIRLGLTGTVSPPLTLCPEIGVACIRAIDAGDDRRALELQEAIVELQGSLLSPSIRKVCGRGVYLAGLRELGFPIKIYPRWPVGEVPQVGIERIRAALQRARSALAKKAA
jgi:dihydrodipicolinate synthase/N-acetylneuraminate lyase